MNVFLDARMFYHSGIGRYGRNLYRELLKLPHPPRLTLGWDSQVKERWESQEKTKPPSLRFNASIYSLGEQIQGGYLQWRERKRFDLFHFPHYNVPWAFYARTVVTCHDLIHLVFPEYFPAHKVAIARKLLERTARKAEMIITISQQSKRDFLSFFPEAEQKIKVIYNGVGKDFFPLTQDEINDFKKEKCLGDYLLYVGNCKPHKNLPGLIAAYAQVEKDFPGLELFILTQDEKQKEVLEIASRWKVREKVKVFNSFTHHELVHYYNAALLLVFPSLYEGFGLPVLEAMACGTPVVASDISSIPEVAGEAAILVKPSEIDSITEGIKRGITDNQVRDKLRRDGLDRAGRFSWKETARQTSQVYQKVANTSFSKYE